MARETGAASAPGASTGPEAQQETAALPGPSVSTDAKSDDASGEVTLSVSGPQHVTSFTIPAEEDSGEEDLTVTRAGVKVSADKASDIKKRAKAAGVTLSEKKG